MIQLAFFLRRTMSDFFTAVQFLTRIPVPSPPYDADSLARSVKFFPIVGLIVGAGAAAVHMLLAPHLPRTITAFLVLAYTLIITGCLHEDGLADAADGFGGGATRERILLIMRDSRIGTYGGVALALSLIGRLLLIASLPLLQVPYYLVATTVLTRWTVLPLSYFLNSARPQGEQQSDGQGARIARITSTGTLIFGTLLSFGSAIALLKTQSIAPILITIALTLCTGLYYKRRLAGITGDCFGATIQLSELAVYLCGVWSV
jgi:adenosylcobinamide-GDP ribazoletransferase